MDFLILTERGTSIEHRINLRHIVEFCRADPGNEGAGTTITLVGGGGFIAGETIAKIEIAIRKLGGKLIAA